MATAAQPRITPEEYLALERRAEFKNEYVNGQVYAMSGASRQHNRIALNAVRDLSTQIRGRSCEVFALDMRVKVSPTGMYTYPDVAALCGDAVFEDKHVDTLLNPSLIIEVLSPTTEAYDRGEKFAHYRRLQSLREYVLVAQDRMRVERFVRDGEQWVLTEISDPDGMLELPSIECGVRLRDLYERVELPPIDALLART